MPFGLDFKSVLVGVLMAWFLIPWIMGLVASKRPAATA